MADEARDIKIITYRPEGQKREFSSYIEISANPREVSLKFCDLKPPATEEELELIKKQGKITIPVDTEIVVPFDVAEALLQALGTQLNTIKEKKEGK
ncbi:MAG: hypothetical protein ACREHC_03775 [Candidatus Levyibacteriota bacterium]